jgi:hypothetical protein
MTKHSFFLRANDHAEWVDSFLFIVPQFLLGDVVDIKIF